MVKLLVYVFVALFGSSSWLCTNSVWMELSQLTQALPEGWTLPSYLTATIQLACVGPLFYVWLHRCTRLSIHRAGAILTMLIFSCLCLLLLSLFWDKTGHVFGAQRSIALLGLTFAMALVNATSN